MAAPIGVQAAKHSVARNRLPDTVKTGVRPFFGAKEHTGVLAGGIVKGHHQVPDLLGHPLMGARVLVHHHPRQRLSLAPLAGLAARPGAPPPPCPPPHPPPPPAAA